MKISIIAAMDEKRGIGKNNKIPWHISEDFKRFKTLTSGHPIIMGRKTWDSLPIKPLPNRYNIVITQNTKYKIPDTNVMVMQSLEEAIKKAQEILKQVQEDNLKEIFVIGGGQIFEQALPLADKLYLTIIDKTFDADTFFPDYSKFKKVVFEESHEGGEYKYKFQELKRD